MLHTCIKVVILYNIYDYFLGNLTDIKMVKQVQWKMHW